MKILALNGAAKDEPAPHETFQFITSELSGRGLELESHTLCDLDIAYCTGCFGCWDKTPGICKLDDAGIDMARAVVQSDLFLTFTPLTFGGYSSELKKAMDRIIPIVSPYFIKIKGELHHKPRYESYPGYIGIGWLDQPALDCEQIFHKLVKRNAINFHAPASTSLVLYIGQTGEAIAAQIAKCLKEVGVQ